MINHSQLMTILVLLSPLTSCMASDKPRSSTLSEIKVLEIVLKNTDVLLTDGQYCNSAAAQWGAKTFADYLAGHWLDHKNTKARNWLDIQIKPIQKNKESTGWQVKLMIYQRSVEDDGQGKWVLLRGNGVQFNIKPNLTADRKSFMCIGTD